MTISVTTDQQTNSIDLHHFIHLHSASLTVCALQLWFSLNSNGSQTNYNISLIPLWITSLVFVFLWSTISSLDAEACISRSASVSLSFTLMNLACHTWHDRNATKEWANGCFHAVCLFSFCMFSMCLHGFPSRWSGFLPAVRRHAGYSKSPVCGI